MQNSLVFFKFFCKSKSVALCTFFKPCLDFCTTAYAWEGEEEEEKKNRKWRNKVFF